MVSSQVPQSPSCRAHKFGGSSLADAGRIRHVASLMLGAEESRQVVVVSAMQGTTNALIAMTNAAAAGEDWQSAWSSLRTQHADAASALLDAPIALQDVAGGPYLVCEFNVPITGFGPAWEEAFRYVLDHGLECADQPCYELYHDDCTGPTCRFDICIPLKKK